MLRKTVMQNTCQGNMFHHSRPSNIKIQRAHSRCMLIHLRSLPPLILSVIERGYRLPGNKWYIPHRRGLGTNPFVFRRWKASSDFLIAEADLAIMVGNNGLLWHNTVLDVAEAHVAAFILIAKIYTYHLQGARLRGQRKYISLQVHLLLKEAEAATFQTL